MKNFILKLLGFCPNHGEYFQYPKKYHKNTAYYEDHLNYGYLPKCCQQEEHDYYQEMWNDYYSSIL